MRRSPRWAATNVLASLAARLVGADEALAGRDFIFNKSMCPFSTQRTEEQRMRSLATYLVCLSAPLALTILSGCGGSQGGATSLSPSDQRDMRPFAISTSSPIVISNNFSSDAINEPPGLKGGCWSVASGSIPLYVTPHTQSSPFTVSFPNGSVSCSTSATIGYSATRYFQDICYLVITYNTAEASYSYSVRQGTDTECGVSQNLNGDVVFTFDNI